MTFKLGTNIKDGQKIKTKAGWRKVEEVTEDGAIVKEGIVLFGATVYGWKGFYITEINSEKIVKEVKKIRRKIEENDENIFENLKYTKKTAFKILANKNKKGAKMIRQKLMNKNTNKRTDEKLHNTQTHKSKDKQSEWEWGYGSNIVVRLKALMTGRFFIFHLKNLSGFKTLATSDIC